MAPSLSHILPSSSSSSSLSSEERSDEEIALLQPQDAGIIDHMINKNYGMRHNQTSLFPKNERGEDAKDRTTNISDTDDATTTTTSNKYSTFINIPYDSDPTEAIDTTAQRPSEVDVENEESVPILSCKTPANGVGDNPELSTNICNRFTPCSSRIQDPSRLVPSCEQGEEENGEYTNTKTNISVIKNRNIHTKRNRLNMIQLAILVFYNVSGGPFGIEETIRAGGNFYALVGFIVFPFVWSIPEALVTAELGSAFKSTSGGVIWVETAFGPLAGQLCGFVSYISGAVDNAIYPTLFLSYLTTTPTSTSEGNGLNEHGVWKFIYASGISIVLAIFNYLGLEFVGNANIVICIASMSPFIVMTVMGIPKVNVSNWFTMPLSIDNNYDEIGYDGVNSGTTNENSNLFDDDFETLPGPLPPVFLGILLRPYLNNLFWNLNSFDAAANFYTEVADPHRNYPRGIFLGTVFCIVLYLVPLLIAIGATDYQQSDWKEGHIANVAKDIGGHWLGTWTIFAIGISNLSLFEAELSADSYQLMGMAEQGYLPKVFKKRSRFGTPTAGIITGTIFIVLMSFADFSQLVEILNSAYAITLLQEYAAFVKLRLYRKDLHRPYRIPIPDWASFLVVLPPCLGILLVFAVSSWMTYMLVIGVFFICFLLNQLQRIAKHREWCIFEGSVEVAEVAEVEIELDHEQLRQDKGICHDM